MNLQGLRGGFVEGGSVSRGIFFAEIPAERILSCPVTGFGCKKEFEYVVLGSQEKIEENVLASMFLKDQTMSFNDLFDISFTELWEEDWDKKIMQAIHKVTKK